MNLKVGDVVILNTGQSMTVSRISDKDQEVQCRWFEDGGTREDYFSEESLTVKEE